MKTNLESQISKHQWRYERPHRVRLFSHAIHFKNASELTTRQIYLQCAGHFSTTDEYRWVEENDIEIDYFFDDQVTSWHKTVLFYADLGEAEYVDYCLRFFRHREEWK
jgi:hypothetical protein